MPVHPRDRKENNHEEMDVDYPEQEASSSDEEDSVSSSASEDGDTSDMDDEDCERRRMECLDEMTNLEKQFTDLKDQLYKERLSQVNLKLQEVIAGSAAEYLEPLATLQENMQIRTKVAAPLKPERHHHVARSEDGRLFYDNKWYSRGQAICINRKDEYPTSATITTINHDEVWYKRLDGSKSKLYISQLQKGKYTIKHS
ncbi:hypothetical protein cypCar_00013696 [Cyprinus carpio]|nr:hypothetical protein cypCar_00013696 [Cyprinus carpio]